MKAILLSFGIKINDDDMYIYTINQWPYESVVDFSRV